ncbi:MAG: class I SAM-dependent methyltransferase [Arachidicoccus sp.]|nr:class I SAM-dependent methyltransferase [Arachidicoccus sp.]
MSNNTTRFSNRVDNYVKYRPDYPKEIISFLQEKYLLASDKTIADIGSGTGISSKLFLDNYYTVTGVEPNKEMRDKSEELLKSYPLFSTKNGTAENTTLPNNSVDAILVGQAFHWFDREKCKPEFERILKPKGLLVLIWNERLTDSEFEKEYDKLIIKHAIDYVSVDHRNIHDTDIHTFCSPNSIEKKIFPNQQIFDFEGLKGRLLSSSYMPTEEQDGFWEMIIDLEILYDKYQSNHRIIISYETKVYVSIF